MNNQGKKEKSGEEGKINNKMGNEGGESFQKEGSAQDKGKIQEMSEKQARLILEGYREQEALIDQQDKVRTRVFPEVLKDW